MATILVVDSSRSVREACRKNFEEEGYRVLLARNAVEARQLIRRERPELAIFDIDLPESDGEVVLEHARLVARQMPVVFFTAYDDACLLDGRAGWATACVDKSEDLDELLRVVATVLAARRRGQSYRLGLPPTLEAVGVGLGWQ